MLQVGPGPKYNQLMAFSTPPDTPPGNLLPPALLLNAVECSGLRGAALLLQLLLQRGLERLYLERVNDLGETPLLAAIRKGDAEVGVRCCVQVDAS